MLAARKLLKRSEREQNKRFLVEGPLAVREALRANAVVEIFVDVEAWPGQETVRQAETKGTPVHLATAAVVAALCDTTTPQGVVAVATTPLAGPAVLDRVDLVVVLAGVRDPGNAGTLIRSSVAAGAGGIVFAKGSVDPLNAKTVRASAGLLFNVPVIAGLALTEVSERLRAAGTRIVGAQAHADTALHDIDMREPVAFVLGNESWGLPEASRQLLDEVVGIPMPGPAESLNVGIAGSILLFEAVRQRRAGP